MKTPRSLLKIALCALAACSLGACATATDPVSLQQAASASKVYDQAITKPRPGTGSLLVIRDSGFIGSLCNEIVILDGSRLASLSTGEKVEAYLKPGRHILEVEPSSICAGGRAGVSFHIHAGDELVYRAARTSTGSLQLYPESPKDFAAN